MLVLSLQAVAGPLIVLSSSLFTIQRLLKIKFVTIITNEAAYIHEKYSKAFTAGVDVG